MKNKQLLLIGTVALGLLSSYVGAEDTTTPTVTGPFYECTNMTGSIQSATFSVKKKLVLNTVNHSVSTIQGTPAEQSALSGGTLDSNVINTGNVVTTLTGTIPEGITLEEGVLRISPYASVGTYSISIQTCEKENSTNCVLSTVEVIIQAVPVFTGTATATDSQVFFSTTCPEGREPKAETYNANETVEATGSTQEEANALAKDLAKQAVKDDIQKNGQLFADTYGKCVKKEIPTPPIVELPHTGPNITLGTGKQEVYTDDTIDFSFETQSGSMYTAFLCNASEDEMKNTHHIDTDAQGLSGVQQFTTLTDVCEQVYAENANSTITTLSLSPTYLTNPKILSNIGKKSFYVIKGGCKIKDKKNDPKKNNESKPSIQNATIRVQEKSKDTITSKKETQIQVINPENLKTITIKQGDKIVSFDENENNFTKKEITTKKGTIRITAYDKGKGIISYTYTEKGKNRNHQRDNTVDTFIIGGINQKGDKIPFSQAGILSVHITDTKPTANPDKNSVTEDITLTATGNVVTGDSENDKADTLSTDTPDDNKWVVSAQSATGTKTPISDTDSGTEIVGKYGTLTLHKDGSYTYTLDKTNTKVQALNTGEKLDDEVFIYTIEDKDGTESTTTLTIDVKGTTDTYIHITGGSEETEDTAPLVFEIKQTASQDSADNTTVISPSDTVVMAKISSAINSEGNHFIESDITEIIYTDATGAKTTITDDEEIAKFFTSGYEVIIPANSLGKPTFAIKTKDDGITEGTENVTMTITEATGDKDNIHSSVATPTADGKVRDLPHKDVIVSEEGLKDGLPDTDGSADTTNSATALGRLDMKYILDFTTKPTDITSDGKEVRWDYDFDTHILIGHTGRAGEIGTKVMTIDFNDADGDSSNGIDYTATLLGPIAHPDTTSEDNKVLNFTAKGSNGNVNFTVTVEDDSPVATGESVKFIAPDSQSQGINLDLILDFSTSMNEKDGNAEIGADKLKASVTNMLQRYADVYGKDNVKVNMIKFSNIGEKVTDGYVDIDTAIQELIQEDTVGMTNYDAALAFAMQQFEKGAGYGELLENQDYRVKNKLYFISDGTPNLADGDFVNLGNADTESRGADAGISDDEKLLWQKFLTDNNIDANAIGIITAGTKEKEIPSMKTNLAQVSNNNDVVDINKLDEFLTAKGLDFTGIPPTQKGDSSGSSSSVFGADGSSGMVELVLPEGCDWYVAKYYGDGSLQLYKDQEAFMETDFMKQIGMIGTGRITSLSNMNIYTFKTQHGKLSIDFDNAEYFYISNDNTTKEEMKLTYILKDKDDDQAQSITTLTFDPDYKPTK